MINYLLGFLSATLFNAIPFFAPGTGFVVTFFYVTYNLNLIILVPIMVLGSTLGRFLLAKSTGKLATKFLHQERNENLSYFRNQVNKKPLHAFIFTFIYCALPTPSNLIFLSLGASNVNLKPILLGFALGRAINYTYAALSFSYIYNRITEELQSSVTSASNIFTQIVTIIVFSVFLLIDWKELILNRKFKLLINIKSKSKDTKGPMKYDKVNEMNISDFSNSNIEKMYEEGFKFTRLSKGNMQSTKNLRVNLKDFVLSSENRRILNKFQDLKIRFTSIPVVNYTYEIGKLGKDFYDTKFGKGTFSANKIKEILKNEVSNFNALGIFEIEDKIVGYVIVFKTENILHYSYPFYLLEYDRTSLGLCMMTKVIELFKNENLKYVYIGGANSKKDIYKLQFKGLEWWDNNTWNSDIEKLKDLIINIENIK